MEGRNILTITFVLFLHGGSKRLRAFEIPFSNRLQNIISNTIFRNYTFDTGNIFGYLRGENVSVLQTEEPDTLRVLGENLEINTLDSDLLHNILRAVWRNEIDASRTSVHPLGKPTQSLAEVTYSLGNNTTPPDSTDRSGGRGYERFNFPLFLVLVYTFMLTTRRVFSAPRPFCMGNDFSIIIAKYSVIMTDQRRSSGPARRARYPQVDADYYLNELKHMREPEVRAKLMELMKQSIYDVRYRMQRTDTYRKRIDSSDEYRIGVLCGAISEMVIKLHSLYETVKHFNINRAKMIYYLIAYERYLAIYVDIMTTSETVYLFHTQWREKIKSKEAEFIKEKEKAKMQGKVTESSTTSGRTKVATTTVPTTTVPTTTAPTLSENPPGP